MKNYNVIRFSVFLGLMLCSNFVFIQAQTVYPVPAKNKNMLFYLQRTFNRNTIVFELNRMKDNTLDTINPVKLHWIRYEEDSQKADLTAFQRIILVLNVFLQIKRKHPFC